MSSLPPTENFRKLSIVTNPFSSSTPSSPSKENETNTPLNPPSNLSTSETPVNSVPTTSNPEEHGSQELLGVIKDVKSVFTDAQKLAYASLCHLGIQSGYSNFDALNFKSVHIALQSYHHWDQKITKRVNQHLQINNNEIEMIENLVKHKVSPEDIASSFLTDQHREAYQKYKNIQASSVFRSSASSPKNSLRSLLSPNLNIKEGKKTKGSKSSTSTLGGTTSLQVDLGGSFSDTSSDESNATSPNYVPLSTDNQFIPETLEEETEVLDPWKPDLRHIVLTDLFLLCVSEFNYDGRSRTLIKKMAEYLLIPHEQVIVLEFMMAQHLDFMDESETPTSKNPEKEFKNRDKLDRSKRMWSMAAAAVGGGLVLGLSAGLAAPFIGAGLGTVFAGMGLTGTTAFLSGTGGAALITTGATLTGSGIAANKMAKRTKGLSDFYFHPISERGSMNVIISIGGWLSKTDESDEDLSSPFTVIDSTMGDHYSLIWEPRALRELGSALKMLASEVITTAVQQALMVTMLHSLLAALTWPLALSRLGYLIDNPWQNALSRSKKAGQILAGLLLQQVQQQRPVTLVGYSLGARVIVYCLLELSKNRGYGLVEDVYLFGCPCQLNSDEWHQLRSVVSGKLVNGYVLNDWILGYLFRLSNMSFGKVAGLSPSGIECVTDLDLTDYVTGHLNYRISTPRLLKFVNWTLSSGIDLDFLEKRDELRKKNQDIQEQVNIDRKLQEKKAKMRKDKKDIMENYAKKNSIGTSSSSLSDESGSRHSIQMLETSNSPEPGNILSFSSPQSLETASYQELDLKSPSKWSPSSITSSASHSVNENLQ
ncbi:hypothetical protein HMI54_002046 [Coelomomyces lativittatus]|nr:hypothetical protein HMI54_002046 [Coelomomyces lativittatus]KAJ1513179.1 hypothetical protein HMI56_002909 [Coelomomyces lativittatus]KAJ1513612.1 hypothetical protein HMI55_005389 [Coelomomyces lativittatus]